MRSRILISLSVSLFLVAAVAQVAGADPEPVARERANRALATMHAEPFVVSGAFTGTMAGEIFVGVTRYLVMPSATVYQLGTGLVPQGGEITDRYVTLTGLTYSGMNLVYSVMLRPEGESASAGDDAGTGITERTSNPDAAGGSE